jgi:hypothetical protein
MTNIAQVVTEKTKAQADVVEVLEDMLARAKNGELTGVVVVGCTVDECSTARWSKSLNTNVLIAGIERFKFSLLSQ